MARKKEKFIVICPKCKGEEVHIRIQYTMRLYSNVKTKSADIKRQTI